MKNIKTCLLFLLGICMMACDDNNLSSITILPSNISSNTPSLGNIYVTGFIGRTGVYWKNGRSYTIDGIHNPTAIAVSKNDVCVVGFNSIYTNTAMTNQAVYWHNGTKVILTDEGTYSYPFSVAISGSDVYVAGLISSSFGNVPSEGVYWKNGIMIHLPNSTALFSIQIVGNDVYAAGGGAYWKNGSMIPVPNASHIVSMVVIRDDVYLVGYIKNSEPGALVAAYWKNGVIHTLGQVARVTDIAVSGADVYVSGEIEKDNTYSAVFWKNGEPNYLSSNGYAYSIAAVGSDVYVSGHDRTTGSAILWKNGMASALIARLENHGHVIDVSSLGIATDLIIN
jgi:hypothetical protein